MRVLFVCGGTAGHINPAIAIAEEVREKQPACDILFVGADKALEKRLIPKAGFELVNIKMSGLRRGFSARDILHNLKTARNLLTASFRSAKLLRSFKPDAVVGTGGYICYPVLKKAAKFGIRTYVLEPNAYPGLAVKMLSATVDKIFVTYKGLENRYKYPERVVYTGTPLKREFYSEEKAAKVTDIPLVISYWGSVGAAGLNNKIVEFIKRNYKESKFNHIHATGVNSSAESLIDKLENAGVSEVEPPLIDIREYISDMPAVMREASLVLCRAGASTIAELTAMGKPAVLIPSPNVTENHQEENAKQLQKAGGAIMLLESECTGDSLFETVTSILSDKEKLQQMSDAQYSLSVKDAAEKIVDIVLKRTD